MENFEKYESLLQSRSYDTLDREERDLVEKFGGREAFEGEQQAILVLKSEIRKTDPGIKKALVAGLKSSKKLDHQWWAIQTPIYSHVLTSVAFFVLGWFLLPQQVEVVTRDRLVEVTKVDTLRVHSRDTIYLERVVQVPVYEVAKRSDDPDPSQTSLVQNRSISESQELLELVIRSDD